MPTRGFYQKGGYVMGLVAPAKRGMWIGCGHRVRRSASAWPPPLPGPSHRDRGPEQAAMAIVGSNIATHARNRRLWRDSAIEIPPRIPTNRKLLSSVNVRQAELEHRQPTGSPYCRSVQPFTRRWRQQSRALL